MDNQSIGDFKFTVTAKLRHGVLWKLVKEFGSQAALARYLNLTPFVLGRLVNLQHRPLPSTLRTHPKWLYVEEQLGKLGYTFADVFPSEWKTGFDRRATNRETDIFVPLAELEARKEQYLLEPPQESKILDLERKEILLQAVDSLPAKDAFVIRYRFGLDGGAEHTLDETAEVLGVTRERIRQREARALQKLRHPGRKLKRIDF